MAQPELRAELEPWTARRLETTAEVERQRVRLIPLRDQVVGGLLAVKVVRRHHVDGNPACAWFGDGGPFARQRVAAAAAGLIGGQLTGWLPRGGLLLSHHALASREYCDTQTRDDRPPQTNA